MKGAAHTLTAVLAAVLLDGHLFRQLRERLIDRLASTQGEWQTSLKPLHPLHGPLWQGGPVGTHVSVLIIIGLQIPLGYGTC